MIDTKKDEKTEYFPSKVSNKECSDTGMAMVLICLLAGWFSGVREWFLGAIVVLVINMISPVIYTWVAKAWLGFSQLLGTVMSKVILSLIFFIVVTPLALTRRVLGHDPMALGKWKKGTDSVFETRDHTYKPEEIEQPF
jgi:hypothetical protein